MAVPNQVGMRNIPVVLYEYRPTRKAENAAAFLEGFSGWLHADGYAGYHRLPKNIRVVGCWAHLQAKIRRGGECPAEGAARGMRGTGGLE